MPVASDPPTRHTADAAGTREDLTVLRPELLKRYDVALPGARAAVLARLLGALDREPLPGRIAHGPGRVTFTLPGGTGRGRAVTVSHPLAGGEPGRPVTTVQYPAAAATPFAPAVAGLAADVDGRQVDDPGTLTRLLWGDVALATEIDNSVANLALARAAAEHAEAFRHDSAADGELLNQDGRPPAGHGGPHSPHGARGPQSSRADPRGTATGPTSADALALVEQSLTDGHPLHPCCRTRGGMSVADVLAYAPEHRPVVRLRRLRVPEDRWYGNAPPILYAHPWQAARIRDRYPWLADAGETGPMRPLMSLRTLAPVGGGPHVKTAVEVLMTSAVRTVSPAAVSNGPVLSALLRELTADLPIGVLAETAAGAVIVDGEPRRELAFLTRAAPDPRHGETVVPLAAAGASPWLLSTVPDPYAWWDRLCAVLFAPLVTVLERGVALEAHGQNTLLVLRDGRPVRVLYRDLGGVRVSPARLRAAGLDAPPVAGGDLAADDPRVLRAKLAAAAFGNAAADLIAALSRWRGADPHRLWGMLAAAVRGTGAADAPHLLRDALPVKATTAMRLAADPLDDLWTPLDNPMAAHT